jgi:hypothetical protein
MSQESRAIFQMANSLETKWLSQQFIFSFKLKFYLASCSSNLYKKEEENDIFGCLR